MRRRFVSDEDGKWVEVPLDYVREPRADHHVMPDIKPYRSMITGELIGSRSTHRDHLRQHGCVEVGNDRSIFNAKPKPLESPPGLKEAIIRAANEKLKPVRR